MLLNRNSGKALDVSGVSTADGARLHQWTRTNANNQQFQFVDAGGGYYRLRARHSGKVLDVSNWSTADGAAIHQWTDHGGTNQQWQLVQVGGGSAGSRAWLRVTADIRPGSGCQATFSYSTDGTTFTPLGPAFTLGDRPKFFMGYRFAIFNHAAALGGAVTVNRFSLTTP